MDIYKKNLGIVRENEKLIVVRPISVEARIFWNMYTRNGLYEFLEDKISRNYPVLIVFKNSINYILIKYSGKDMVDIIWNGKRTDLEGVQLTLNDEDIFYSLVGGEYL